MKVPPKRKGNPAQPPRPASNRNRLNESPSEKEGKYEGRRGWVVSVVSLNESPSEKEGK